MEGSREQESLDETINELYVHTYFAEAHLSRAKKLGVGSDHLFEAKKDELAISKRDLFPEILNELRDYKPDHPDPNLKSIYLHLLREDSPEFQKYLPWFLEEVARERDFGSDTQRLFAKFREAKFPEWHIEDKTRIENYVRALWRADLVNTENDDGADYSNAGELLDCFTFVLPDLSPLLEIWLGYCRAYSEPALRRFYTFLEYGWAFDTEGKRFKWEHYDPTGEVEAVLQYSRKSVQRWLLRAKTREVFESICLAGHDNTTLEWAFAIVERLLLKSGSSQNRETSC